MRTQHPARAGRPGVNPRLGADGHETDRHRLGRARRGVHSNVLKAHHAGAYPLGPTRAVSFPVTPSGQSALMRLASIGFSWLSLTARGAARGSTTMGPDYHGDQPLPGNTVQIARSLFTKIA